MKSTANDNARSSTLALDPKRRRRLIETINVLGPWTHGYFDLGDGLVIQDFDSVQQRRLLAYKEFFIQAIQDHFGSNCLTDKTVSEIGCNAGFFLLEMYKHFRFARALGLEPRPSNLAKARFIARILGLETPAYAIKQFDLLKGTQGIPASDVVLVPSVLHHVDDLIGCLRTIHRMTANLCILDCLVLPESMNTPRCARLLELKDEIYRHGEGGFGLVGYKLENNSLDGSAYQPGIVGIPTTSALVMMLRLVGFEQVEVIRNEKELKRDVYNHRQYRDVHAVVVKAVKGNAAAGRAFVEQSEGAVRAVQQRELETVVPLTLIEPLYELVMGRLKIKDLPPLPKLVHASEARFGTPASRTAGHELAAAIGQTLYFSTISTFRHAFEHKVRFEYCQALRACGRQKEARQGLLLLTRELNLDWRCVYKTYHVLACISLHEGDIRRAKRYNALCLRAFHRFHPALDFRKSLLTGNGPECSK